MAGVNANMQHINTNVNHNIAGGNIVQTQEQIQVQEVEEEQMQIQAQEVEEEQMFAVTPTAIALWDYANEIVQDNTAWARNHPHAPRAPHPPIPMSRHDKCFLTLMAEERRDEIWQLFNELIEVERLLGLEDM